MNEYGLIQKLATFQDKMMLSVREPMCAIHPDEMPMLVISGPHYEYPPIIPILCRLCYFYVGDNGISMRNHKYPVKITYCETVQKYGHRVTSSLCTGNNILASQEQGMMLIDLHSYMIIQCL